ANTIENLAAGNFSNDGTLKVTGDLTSLLLLNDKLTNYTGASPGTERGTIQVDDRGTGQSRLELQTTTIDGGKLFNNGLLEATSGTANTIENLAAGNFSNDGTLKVTGDLTSLLLLNDKLTNYTGASPGTELGTIQVDDSATGQSTLELQTT